MGVVTMATKAVYITVRLDIEGLTETTISDEAVNDLISEMDYSFRAPEDNPLTITDTEICGRND